MAFSLYDGTATWDTTGVTSTPAAPPPAELVFSDAVYSVGEADGTAVITVNRTGSTSGSATVDYATADDSAVSGVDYAAASGTLSFADGETSQSFSVPIVDDGQVEGNESILLTLSGANGADLGSVSEAQLTIVDDDSNDVAWFDDAVPAGAVLRGTWNWVSVDPPPYSGALAHQSELAAGFHQHYFTNASDKMLVQAGETLYVYIYLDPVNPPREVMLSWDTNGRWKHNAYWGEDLINVGTPGTNSRRYIGSLPPLGEWARLEVSASVMGLEGTSIRGMAFSLYDGTATWDSTGLTSP
jgi:hypothetical protein